MMRGCRRLERACRDPEAPIPKTCVDRMKAEIRFHNTDILNSQMVKCRKGLDERGVTGAAHFLAQLQKCLHYITRVFSHPCLMHALILLWHESLLAVLPESDLVAFMKKAPKRLKTLPR